jgi:hypothetical protein
MKVKRVKECGMNKNSKFFVNKIEGADFHVFLNLRYL